MTGALGLAVMLCALTVSAQSTDLQPTVFYNARMALREGEPAESLKLWLLRNSIVDQGIAPSNDTDFHSVLWVALGDLGLCQDGIAKDEHGGAGLWPLAMHNWVLTSVAKGGPVDNPSPFDAFEAGLQQRFISLHDVLSSEELRSASFFRTNCWAPQVVMLDQGQPVVTELTDRLVSGPFLKSLLERALRTMSKTKVQNRAILEARLFDLDLAMAALLERQAAQLAQQRAQDARGAGASERAVKDLETRTRRWSVTTKQAEFLRRALTWPVRDWLVLSQPRRLSLFAQARAVSNDEHPGDPQPFEALLLGLIDELIERKAGAELELWLGWLDASKVTSRRQALITGERGKRILELDAESGFRERSVIALHRGLAFLEAGDMREALISFAFAMAHAESSREPTVTMSLARRWVSYVLARYEATDEVIATLKALVPSQEYNSVVEDLIWRAALNADLPSFNRLMATTRRGGSFDARAIRLRLLAQGNAGALATQLRDAVKEEPFFTVRFVRQVIEKLEAEEVDVRRANVPLIKLMVQVLDAVIGQAQGNSAHARAAEELLGRTQGLLEGLKAFEPSVTGKARALSPNHEAFAGNIRLAPTDPLPWPFQMPDPEPPSAFTPITITPVEWRDPQGALVFGWRLSE